MAPKPKTPPPKSPFLAPRRSSSYGGVSVDSGGTPRSSPHTSSILSIEHQHHHEKEVEPEHKSNLIGCTANLITAIVGAGIIGIPYAMRETGLFAGWLLILLSGVLGSKSLCLCEYCLVAFDILSHIHVNQKLSFVGKICCVPKDFDIEYNIIEYWLVLCIHCNETET